MSKSIIYKGYSVLKEQGISSFLQKSLRYSVSPSQTLSRKFYPLPPDFDDFHYPPDPFKILPVSPDDIQRFSGRKYPPYQGADARLGVVMNGDWDRTEPDHIDPEYLPRYRLYRGDADRFSECIFFKSLEAHFDDKVPWKETDWYQTSLEIIRSGRQTTKGITTRSALDQRCLEIDALYDTIATKVTEANVN